MYAIGENEIRAVARVVKSGQLFRYRGGEGQECDKFEKEALCAKLGRSTASCSTAARVR